MELVAGWSEVVEAGSRAEMQRFPEERRLLTLNGALNQRAWTWACGLISIFSPLVSMHRHSLRGYEGLQVPASSSLAAFLSLLPVGEAVPRGLGVGI